MHSHESKVHQGLRKVGAKVIRKEAKQDFFYFLSLLVPFCVSHSIIQDDFFLQFHRFPFLPKLTLQKPTSRGYEIKFHSHSVYRWRTRNVILRTSAPSRQMRLLLGYGKEYSSGDKNFSDFLVTKQLHKLMGIPVLNYIPNYRRMSRQQPLVHSTFASNRELTWQHAHSLLDCRFTINYQTSIKEVNEVLKRA